MNKARICGLKQDESRRYYIPDEYGRPVWLNEPFRLRIIGDTYQSGVGGKRKDIVRVKEDA